MIKNKTERNLKNEKENEKQYKSYSKLNIKANTPERNILQNETNEIITQQFIYKDINNNISNTKRPVLHKHQSDENVIKYHMKQIEIKPKIEKEKEIIKEDNIYNKIRNRYGRKDEYEEQIKNGEKINSSKERKYIYHSRRSSLDSKNQSEIKDENKQIKNLKFQYIEIDNNRRQSPEDKEIKNIINRNYEQKEPKIREDNSLFTNKEIEIKNKNKKNKYYSKVYNTENKEKIDKNEDNLFYFNRSYRKDTISNNQSISKEKEKAVEKENKYINKRHNQYEKKDETMYKISNYNSLSNIKTINTPSLDKEKEKEKLPEKKYMSRLYKRGSKLELEEPENKNEKFENLNKSSIKTYNIIELKPKNENEPLKESKSEEKIKTYNRNQEVKLINMISDKNENKAKDKTEDILNYVKNIKIREKMWDTEKDKIEKDKNKNKNEFEIKGRYIEISPNIIKKEVSEKNINKNPMNTYKLNNIFNIHENVNKINKTEDIIETKEKIENKVYRYRGIDKEKNEIKNSVGYEKEIVLFDKNKYEIKNKTVDKYEKEKKDYFTIGQSLRKSYLKLDNNEKEKEKLKVEGDINMIERKEREKIEKEINIKLIKEKLEKERIEKEILKKEKIENDRLERERERKEKERIEKKKNEERERFERLEKQRKEKEKIKMEKMERERIEKERKEKEKEKKEKERIEKERKEKEKKENEERKKREL